MDKVTHWAKTSKTILSVRFQPCLLLLLPLSPFLLLLSCLLPLPGAVWVMSRMSSHFPHIHMLVDASMSVLSGIVW